MSHHFNTPEFKQALIQMVNLYGEGKWAEIARALQTIYGYQIGNMAVNRKWNLINPQKQYCASSRQEETEFWQILLQCKGNYYAMVTYYQENYQRTFLKSDVASRIAALFKSCLKDITKVAELQRYLRLITSFKPSTFKNLIELSFMDDQTNDDEFQRVKQNSSYLVGLCEILLSSLSDYEKRKQIKDKLKNIQQFDEAIKDAALINLLLKLRYPTQKQHSRWTDQGQQEPTIVGSDSEDSDCKHFPQFYIKLNQKEILNHEPDPYDKRLKKDEIDEYKSHYLYLRLFDNNTRHFYHFYNSASLNKSSDQQQYSMKMNQQQEKQSNRRVKLEQLTGKCKIQSLRHRMKEQQAIFHNPMTMKFSYEDREVDEDDVEIEKFKQLCLLK